MDFFEGRDKNIRGYRGSLCCYLCPFCFRGDSLISKIPEEFRKDYEAESVRHKEKLDCLKAKIRNKEGAHILNYEAKWNVQEQKVCGLEFFAEELERK